MNVGFGEATPVVPPETKVAIWVAFASTPALLVQAATQVRAESGPQALSVLSTSFTCTYLAPAPE